MMEGVPDVTERVIKAVGSVAQAVDALRGDDTEDALCFIHVYDSISPSDRKRLKLEEIFTAAKLTSRQFIEVLTGALMQQCQDVTKMMVAVAQPKVIQATIKAATDQVPITAYDNELECMRVVGYTNGDTKAMEIFHKATGFLPTPKGANTTINLNQLNQTANVNGEDDDDDDSPGDLQSMDEYLIELQDVIRPPKSLSAPVENVIPASFPDVEYVDAEV